MGDDMIQTPEELANWSTGSLAESINLLLQTYRIGLMQSESLILSFKNAIQTETVYDLLVQQKWNVEYNGELSVKIWM
jgi:hypothetical protein